MMTTRFFQLSAWIALAIVIFVTVSPIQIRPHDVLPVNVDRALAFAVMAGLFVTAYPRQSILCIALLVLAAGGIEMLQYLSPTRHAQTADAIVKAFGVIVGSCAGLAANRIRNVRSLR